MSLLEDLPACIASVPTYQLPLGKCVKMDVVLRVSTGLTISASPSIHWEFTFLQSMHNMELNEEAGCISGYGEGRMLHGPPHTQVYTRVYTVVGQSFQQGWRLH